jgi:predicted  nucleic acid-binding Zn-ribbon protein
MSLRDTPLKDREDYLAKRKALQDIQLDPDTHKDPALKAELMRRVVSLKKQAEQQGLEEADHSFDLSKLDAGSRKLITHVRGKYQWADSDLEALLAYIKDEDNNLESDINNLEKHDSVHDTEIDSLDSELDKEQASVHHRLASIELRVKEIADRVFGRK